MRNVNESSMFSMIVLNKDGYNTIQYNTLLTTPHGGFSVTMQLRNVTIISKKDKINSKLRQELF